MPEAGSEAARPPQPNESRTPDRGVTAPDELAVADDATLEDRVFDPDPAIRALAVHILATHDHETIDEVLSSALEDDCPDVALAAAEGIAKRGGSRAADRLAECLAARPGWIGPLALAMEALGDPGLEDLLWQWVDEAEPTARVAIMRAIGACGGARSASGLLRCVASGSPALRLAALAALARLRQRQPHALGRGSLGPGAGDWILDLLRESDPTRVRTGIDLAAWLKPAGSLPAIVSCMDAPDESVRHAALEAFGTLALDGEGLALEALEAGSPPMIATGLDRLATARDPASRRSLLRLFGHPEPEVRERAAALAGRAGDRDIARALRGLLDDAVGHVRARAAEALGRLGDEGAAVRLEELLGDPYADVREAASGALAALPGHEVDAPRALARAGNAGSRAAAIRALDLSRVPGTLESAVADPAPEIRIAVAASLAARAQWNAGASSLLLDEDPRVRAHAVDARLRARPLDDLGPLAPLVRDPDAGVRQLLALGLAGGTCAQSLNWLRRLLRDDGPAVARAAARGLARRREPEALLALLDAASGGSVPVAAAAIEALEERGDRESLPRLRALARGGPGPIQPLADRAARTLAERRP